MRNFTFYLFLILILLAIGYAWKNLGPEQDFGMFLITSLTALGTCCVTVLNIFPYYHKDRLDAELYYGKNKQITLKIKNKTNHTVYIGSDNHSMSFFSEDYAIWWPNKDMDDFEDAHMLYTNPGDNLAIPPNLVIYYPIDKKEFKGVDVTKIKMLVHTSKGDRYWVKNKLGAK